MSELFAQAEAIAQRAYAPYSKFLVGAAVLTRDGRVIVGTNVESASYSLAVCAERSALTTAVAQGYRPGDIEELAVTASPCGGCRQWLVEFGIDRVTYRNNEGQLVTTTPAELLPDTFEL